MYDGCHNIYEQFSLRFTNRQIDTHPHPLAHTPLESNQYTPIPMRYRFADWTLWCHHKYYVLAYPVLFPVHVFFFCYLKWVKHADKNASFVTFDFRRSSVDRGILDLDKNCNWLAENKQQQNKKSNRFSKLDKVYAKRTHISAVKRWIPVVIFGGSEISLRIHFVHLFIHSECFQFCPNHFIQWIKMSFNWNFSAHSQKCIKVGPICDWEGDVCSHPINLYMFNNNDLYNKEDVKIVRFFSPIAQIMCDTLIACSCQTWLCEQHSNHLNFAIWFFFGFNFINMKIVLLRFDIVCDMFTIFISQ